ncbi:alpha-ketoacid dehydrogenase subunit alpha/beta [Nocardioides endophyticus]|uniref:dihydrolipoyllysine-residue succinyltransferase n=1 Tax=Nocardioides endophyticus TaxID=1353775 RepID=A0ABP8ZCK2_9ACTN
MTNVQETAAGTLGRSNRTDLAHLHCEMLRIRMFEDRAAGLYRDGVIRGFVHLSVGQEAVPVGTVAALRPDDVITSTHRGHGHVLAKGLDLTGAFAELFGKETGTNHGRGGSMHIADPGLGIFGANGIVGAGVPIAAGAATASLLRGDGKVAVSFFGDGATSTGAFHEGATLAGDWRLPLILLCENNQFSEFTGTHMSAPERMEARAAAYGMSFHRIDGNDVQAMADAMTTVVDAVRRGEGPAFVEAVTFRARGHYEGDQLKYRDAELAASWAERDPILMAEAQLIAGGTSEAEIAAVHASVSAEVEEAVATATAAPEPSTGSLFEYIRTVASPVVEADLPVDAEETRYSRAVKAALRQSLLEDPEVFVAGIDVGEGGNVFGLTRGLNEEFPGRVRDTPIAEAAIIGAGVGAAMAGMRPVVEIMYSDFLGVCLDQIMNQAAKLRYMTGGKVSVPLTVRTQFGAGRSSGAQHSQSIEAMLAHIPGLSVVMPSTPADAYGLLRSAIAEDSPVIVIEHRLLYEKAGPGFALDHLVPIGKAKVLREGSDVTVVSFSRMARESLVVAEKLAGEGISVEVIDLRTVAPIDWETVLSSLAKTNKLVIAHEAVSDFGVGAEIAARAVDEGFWSLDAPVLRVGAPFTPAPYAPALEKEWVVGQSNIENAVRRILAITP